MKVIRLSYDRLDAYFKEKDKAEMFPNYWKTIYPSAGFRADVLCVEGMRTICKLPLYNYSFNDYAPVDVIEGYLQLFPEERE